MNFRYSLEYLKNTWWEMSSDSLPNLACINKYLKAYPKVYFNFKSVVESQADNTRKEHFNHESNNILWNVKCDFNILSSFLSADNSRFESLVCAGADTHLSKNIKHLQKIKHKFKKIYYEAKDIECDWVQTIPMGMIATYMLRNGGNDVILPQINKNKNKTKLIASAFGSKWPFLTKKIADRSKLKNYTSNCSFIDDMFCEPNEYYVKLCDYRFFACPVGRGIQTPKICECVMCETVPVVTDHVAHRELRDVYDLPLLIVNEWSHLTEKYLNDQWDSTYSKIDWYEQKKKFFVDNFNKLIT